MMRPLVSSVSKTHSAEPPVNAATKGAFRSSQILLAKKKRKNCIVIISQGLFSFFNLSGRINEVNNIVLLKTFILNLQLLDQFKYRIYPPIERRSVTSRYHGSKISGSGI